MTEWNPAVVQKLAGQNPEFKRLYDEHLDLEAKLDRFAHLHYLTPQEELEKRELQKKKLAGKDRMLEMIAKDGGH